MVAEDIVPVGEFKAHLAERLRGLQGHGRPLIVTQNGKPAAVVLTPEAFDRLNEQGRFVAAVSQGLKDADEGKFVTDAEFGRLLARRVKSRAAAK
jgi:prevent-host-death family protein